jgi:hypothetical protein
MKDDDKTLRHFSVLFTSGNVSNLVLRFAWDLKWIDGFVRLLFRVYRPQNEWDYLTSDIKFVFLHLAFKTCAFIIPLCFTVPKQKIHAVVFRINNCK